MEDESMIFKVMNDEGKEIECEVLATFDLEETGKSYIIYTDNNEDEDGETPVYASIFDPNDPTKLEPVETDAEWAAIEEVLARLQEEIDGEND